MATASLPKEDHNYIETHGIQQIFVNAAVQLCAMRPENPFSFLRQYFQVLESMENPYQCIFCNEILEFAMFELHMHKCRNALYRCSVCHQSFPDSQSLQNHRSIHAGAMGPSEAPPQPPPPQQQQQQSAPPPAYHINNEQHNHMTGTAPNSHQPQHHQQQQQLNNSQGDLSNVCHQPAFGQYQDMQSNQPGAHQQNHLNAHHMAPGVHPGQPFPNQNYSMTHPPYATPSASSAPPNNLNPMQNHMNYHPQQQQQPQPHHHQQHHHHNSDEPYNQSHLSELMNFHTSGDIKHEPPIDVSEHNSQSESFTPHSDSSEQTAAGSGATPTAATTNGNANKAYTCETCNRSFLHKHRYLRHVTTHTDERPYVCKVCSKAFSQTYYLSRHEKTHTDEKPYQCEICLKSFSQTYYLSRHIKTHSGDRPFQCTVCQKSFVLNYSLRKHMKTHAASGS